MEVGGFSYVDPYLYQCGRQPMSHLGCRVHQHPPPRSLHLRDDIVLVEEAPSGVLGTQPAGAPLPASSFCHWGLRPALGPRARGFHRFTMFISIRFGVFNCMGPLPL